MTRLRSLIIGAFAAVVAVGCAGTPRPDTLIVTTEASIRGASEAGAPSVPAANLYYRMAREKRQAALVAIANGDNDTGRSLLARSEADAELAVVLAREADAAGEAARATERMQDLDRKVMP